MKDKILVVGDIHGEWDKLNRLINKKKPNIVLQCGDFGYWPMLEVKSKKLYGSMKMKAWKLEGVKPQGSKVYWCDGNHEDHYALDNLSQTLQREPIEIYENVFYCQRGSILKLSDGRTVMFIGGADSIDKHYRTLGIDWFEEELISKEQENFILDYDGKVDIIISHTCPLEWEPREKIYGHDKHTDPTRKFLSEVLLQFKPDQWFHGHWHEIKRGHYENTRWTSLNHCSSGSVWWKWLD